MPIDPLSWIGAALAERERAGLLRRRKGDRASGLINFGSNDYLGLAGDPRLAEAAWQSAQRHGWGSGASPVVCGRSEAHTKLERLIAEYEHSEEAILFPSGFAANAGVIPALVDEGDALYADSNNHASLIDGCRLSRASRFIYPHCDTATLAAMLAEGGAFRRRLIVTDTLFSMDGDFAPLAELARLAAEHDAMLLVDEAHATGVWGPTGRGAVEQLSEADPALAKWVSIRVGTLSKALGCSGGFVTGRRDLIEWLYNTARPYVFSTAAPPATAAAAVMAIRLARQEPERREHVQQLAEWLRAELKRDGWRLGHSTSQIVPVYLGEPDQTVWMGESLAQKGMFVPAIRPPSVPEGESLLRISVTANHSREVLEMLLGSLRTLRPTGPAG